MEAILTLNIILLALAGWAALFWVIPSCSASLFRYRLWRLRDELVDDVRHGKYADSTQPLEVVSMIETAIESARDLTALKLAMFHVSMRGVEIPESLDLDRLQPEDRKRLTAVLHAFGDAGLAKILGGSPSGWLVGFVTFPLALIFALARAVIHRGKPDAPLFKQAKENLRDGLEIDPAVAAISARHQSGGSPLYQHV